MITKKHICTICYEHIIPKWYSTPEAFPNFLQYYTQDEKNSNEAFLEQLISEFREVSSTLKQNPTDELKTQIKEKVNTIIETENLLHIKDHISKELFSDFEENLECFVEKTQAFDKNLSPENIWQAMRNYLIYCMIVNLQGEKQNCKDTILGYSLLYPYTDNFIDACHRKFTDKNSYNQLIRKTLMGESVTPANIYEEKTKQLLHLVLDSYSNDLPKQQEASNLLLLMLEAQENSILQIHKFGAKKLTTDEILHISVYKGGLSVLIDYLFSINFHISTIIENEVLFYLSFGLILQLADDLQDITEDRKNHSQTLFSTCKTKKQLETMVNRLLYFTHTCIASFSPRNSQLHTFTLQNCELMLLAAVAKNAKYFSKSYLEKIEEHLPFSISFLEKAQSINN